MTKRSIHQMVHTLSYGDAISTEVLSLQRCLQELGCESKIFAINEHPRYRGLTEDYRKLKDETSGDIILHYSLGSPLNAEYRAWNKGRRFLIYHNITPAKWFSKINKRVAEDIERGLDELPELCKISDLLLADSAFNASELAQMGFQSQVLKLPVDSKRWERPRNNGIYSLLKNDPALHLLHVGRLAPNKCIEDIIRVFYFIHHHIEPNSKLWLVGIDTDTELYSFSLKRLAASFRLDHAVIFAKGVSDEEVRSFYEASSAYLCMSEHEGFCLPLVEAMYFGLPVIGFDAGAVPDTIGDAGVIVKEKRHAEIAELIVELHRNSSMRQRLIEAGKSRVGQLSYANFMDRVRETILNSSSVVSESRLTA